MIIVEFRNYDMGKDPNYPDIEMTLDKTGNNIAYITNMFRQFLLAMEFSPNLVEEYIPRVDNVDEKILERSIEKINELSEKNAKVSEESADNVTSSKIIINNNTDKELELEHKDDGSIDIKLHTPIRVKSVKDWTIEDWRAEFVRWMKEKGTWVAYDAVRCKSEELDGIGHIEEFVNYAFVWSENEEIFSESEWCDISNDWKGHINILKQEI